MFSCYSFLGFTLASDRLLNWLILLDGSVFFFLSKQCTAMWQKKYCKCLSFCVCGIWNLIKIIMIIIIIKKSNNNSKNSKMQNGTYKTCSAFWIKKQQRQKTCYLWPSDWPTNSLHTFWMTMTAAVPYMLFCPWYIVHPFWWMSLSVILSLCLELACPLVLIEFC